MSPNFTIGAPAITRLFANLIKTTLACNTVLCDLDYFKMADGNTDISRLIEKGNSSSESFKAVAAYFKANTGRTVERSDELFDRAAAEMKEFVMALSAAKIKLLFAQVSEPQGTSKPAFIRSRSNYNNGSPFSRGSSSKASVHTPAKTRSVGFGDADAPDETSEVNSSADSPVADSGIDASRTSTPRAFTPQTRVPQTPTPSRKPRSIADQSSMSRRVTSQPLGFGDASDSEDIKDNKDTKDNDSFDVSMSEAELSDMSLVSDFIDPSHEKYDVEYAVIEFIQESVRTKRAMSDVSKEVLAIIRDTHRNPKQRSITNALGYENDIEDMPSPIMQWVLKNVSHSG
ncbi:hypothetical protein CDD83_4379 [Cordyceps sp. RAO-2017]|nr:hypothetical protein CDD83_4379 [Cordyceps sp. RAO-2017]